MRVLVVEDDRALGQFLQKGLAVDGHEVDWVEDGDAALEHAELNRPAMIVLDLSLPRRDGTEVLAEIRQRWPEIGVLVLTGRGQVHERVRCLLAGADDILLKPFSFAELSARVLAVLRRSRNVTGATLEYGAVEMNRLNRRVRRDGNELELTTKEFSLLEYLLERRGACCSRMDLLREVWQMSPDATTNVVDVYINYLRKKLAAAHPEGPLSARVIETVRGEGYRVCSGRKPVASARAPQPAMLPMAGAA